MDRIYPVYNAFRHSRLLHGNWHFAFDRHELNWEKQIPKGMMVTVPSDLQDNFIDLGDRQYASSMWFERHEFIPKEWLGEILQLHFDGIGRRAIIYVNGMEVGHHNGVFIPVVFDITRHIRYGEENQIIVKVNNEIRPFELPTGHVKVTPIGDKPNVRHVDYHVPSGLYDSVYITVAPQNRMIDVSFQIEEATPEKAVVSYVATIKGNCLVTAILRDQEGRVVATGVGGNGRLSLDSPHLWTVGDGYLYRVDFDVSRLGKQHDTYSVPLGIRTVQMQKGMYYLNGAPIRLQGIRLQGHHVDSVSKTPMVVRREMSRLLSLGGNCMYSGGYPLPQFVLTMADEMGILIIDEFPAAGLGVKHVGDLENRQKSFYCGTDAKLRILPSHVEMIKSLMESHKNHPSIIGWSLIHEPGLVLEADESYFATIVETAKALDPEHRPLIMTTRQKSDDIHKSVVKLFDCLIISQWSDARHNEQDITEGLRDWQAAYPELPLVVRLAEVNDNTLYMSPAECMAMNEHYMLRQLKALNAIGVVCGEFLESVDFTYGGTIKDCWK